MERPGRRRWITKEHRILEETRTPRSSVVARRHDINPPLASSMIDCRRQGRKAGTVSMDVPANGESSQGRTVGPGAS